MRKSLAGLMGIASICVVSFAHATYLIKLKNGNEYVTNRYWQEGSQVLFDAEGGIFGIDKEFVSKIDKTDRVIRLLSQAAPDPAEKPTAAAKETAQDASNEAPADTKTPLTKDPNDPVYKEFSSLKAQSDNLRTMSPRDLDEYVINLVGLMKKIQDERKMSQYLREYSELNAMANRAEAELKSRG